MWTIAEYQPTALFSLRPYLATSSGGKSLIVPTPFAIKMALLDAAIRTQGIAQGRDLFPTLRDLRIAIRLPQWILVNKTLVKILRINDSVSKKGSAEKGRLILQAREERKWPYQGTVGFREYVQYSGPFALAFHGAPTEDLVPLLIQINYLGKRGCFIQLLGVPQRVEELPSEFTVLTEDSRVFPLGTLQMLDDCSRSLTFEQANVYNDATIRPNIDRIFHHVVLPHRPVRSARGFTLYEWQGDGQLVE